MFPNADQGFGILLGAIGVGILLLAAARAGFFHLSFLGFTFQKPHPKTQQELEWEREDRKEWSVVERRQIEAAFTRYGEAAVGLAAMVNAPGPANETVSKWFDLTAGAIDAAVTKHMGDNFRVAIWADWDDDTFRLLGCANHDTNNPRMQRLNKANTIGGLAWRAKEGEYLCSDISKDRKYKQRTPGPRPYRSIFAIRVGEASEPWGVLTIDAPRLEGFTPLDLFIIRRFARLVSIGAVIALTKYAPGTRPIAPAGAAGNERIVLAPDAGAAQLTTEEHPDDRPS